MFRHAAWLAFLLAACDDEAGPAAVLVRSDAASAAQCANGGSVVRTGADLDGDGVLDADEVTHTTPVCREPIAVVTRVAQEPPGSRCAAGGTRLESGADRDGDGALDDDEVARSDVHCGDSIAGDLVVASDSDVSALVAVRSIGGILSVQGGAVTRLILPDLQFAGGVRIADAPALTEVALGSLVAMPRSVEIARNGALATATVSAASCDGAHIDIIDNAALGSVYVNCPRLASLRVEGHPALETAHFYAGPGDDPVGALRFRANARLAYLAVSASRVNVLELTGTAVQTRINAVGRNNSLAVNELDIEAPITSFPVWVHRSARLRGTRLSRFEALWVEQLTLIDNPELTAAVAATARDITASNNPKLTTLAIRDIAGPAPQQVRRAVSLVDNPVLASAPWLAHMTEAESLILRNNPALQPFPADTVLRVITGQCELDGVGGVRTLHVDTIDMNGLVVARTSVERLVVRSLAHASHAFTVAVVDNPLLLDLDVEAPGAAMASLDVSRNPQLRRARLAVPARSVDVTIVDNRALPACLAQRVLDAITSSGSELQSGNDEAAICP